MNAGSRIDAGGDGSYGQIEGELSLDWIYEKHCIRSAFAVKKLKNFIYTNTICTFRQFVRYTIEA